MLGVSNEYLVGPPTCVYAVSKPVSAYLRFVATALLRTRFGTVAVVTLVTAVAVAGILQPRKQMDYNNHVSND